MEACRYCGERDPFRLALSTRIVNGKAETISVCSSCCWREKFEAGRDGALREKGLERERFSEPGASSSSMRE